MTYLFARIGLAAALLTALPLSGAVMAGDKGPTVFAEARPDKALVYFIRTGRFSAAARTLFLYADKTFLGALDNGTYGYAYVEPGKHLFWRNWYAGTTRELELVPGQTYYLEVWNDIAVIDEAAGKALIARVKEHVTPTSEEIEASARHIRRRYDDSVEEESLKDKVPVPEPIAAAPPPAETEGLVKVPAYSPVDLVLLETVTSEFTSAGSTVYLKIAEDVAVSGQVYVRRGAVVTGVVRESRQAGGLGKAGSLDLVVPAVTATDGTTVPLVSQVAAAGENRQDIVAIAQLGVLPGLMVRGREAYHLAGEKLRAFTRNDVWLKPGHATDAATAEPEGASATGTALALPARGPQSIRFNPRKGYTPDDVVFVLDAPGPVSEVEILAIRGQRLPIAVKARKITPVTAGWQAEFDGWSVVRFAPAAETAAGVPIALGGRLSDGRAFTAECQVELNFEP